MNEQENRVITAARAVASEHGYETWCVDFELLELREAVNALSALNKEETK